MNDAAIIFKREFKAYFYSPIAYVFSIIFILLNASLYMFHFFFFGNADMRAFFSTLPIVLGLIFIPAITMRLWSEENKLGTVELLLTLPMKTESLRRLTRFTLLMRSTILRLRLS